MTVRYLDGPAPDGNTITYLSLVQPVGVSVGGTIIIFNDTSSQVTLGTPINLISGILLAWTGMPSSLTAGASATITYSLDTSTLGDNQTKVVNINGAPIFTFDLSVRAADEGEPTGVSRNDRSTRTNRARG